jgi:phosphoglycerate dehydrogenase-like enzyme
VFQGLINSGKVIFTPHIAGKSFESKRKIAEVLLKKIRNML